MGGEFRAADRRGRLTQHHQAGRAAVAADGVGDGQIQHPGKLGVVAEFRVGVQWQMIGKQADLMAEQGGESSVLHADQARIFALPEIAVMHQHGIRPLCHRCFQ